MTALKWATALGTLIMVSNRGRTEDLADRFEAGVFKSANRSIGYRLLRPESTQSGERYPLVLFFHGAGERGGDNRRQLIHGAQEFAKPENRRRHPCFVLAPQCPSGTWWSAPSRESLGKQLPSPHEPLELTLLLVRKLIDELPVDPDRVYVTGLSMGGFATWDLVSRNPELFAAAAPICGGGDVGTAPRIKSLPLWVFHGAEDKVVPARLSRAMVDAVRKAGGDPKYTEYAGVGHDSWTATYANPEFHQWLFSQSRKGRNSGPEGKSQ